jgi:hypothetical protein
LDIPVCNLRQAVWSRQRRLFQAARFAVLVLMLAPAAHVFAEQSADPSGQEPRPDTPEPIALPTSNVARSTIHGVIKNAATGEPLPRALVRMEGDATAGALTDGDGRFEIPGVPNGAQVLQVIKPGFIDTAGRGASGPPVIINGSSNTEHSVRIAADMPDMVFTLTPTNAIRGQIELSTGDPAQNITVTLLRRTVQEGRAVWQTATNVRTNSDGVYRFAGLADGAYLVYTEPAMDTDIAANLIETGSDQAVMRAGYPVMFYPDARDIAGAGKIQISGGEQAQANLLLTEEPFHLLRASLTLPGAAPASGDGPALNVNITVLDAQGHSLPYTGQYDQATHSVQSFLPDGTYSLLVSALGTPKAIQISGANRVFERTPAHEPMVGQVDFSVAGHAVTHLRMPLAAQRSNAIQLSLLRGSNQQAGNSGAQGAGGGGSPLVIMVSQAGGSISDGMVSSYAEGYATGPIDTATFMNPGAYWVHTNIPQKGLCESSFTAGGASLAREPLMLSLAGTSAPLTLTLRDDCSNLWLALPQTVSAPEVGEEPSYTVYVVPDFDSTADVTPITLRPSSGGSFLLTGLTPGSYHVYAFPAPVELEYRNPEALAALPRAGQTITLQPSEMGKLVLEVPEH